MSKQYMITTPKANCKELYEKKLQFERMIQALELDDVAK
ncbi:hypothetical protein A2U01_0108037, partial [Trifolium medium]|nr:hypothetical protein [Trifolium medium]